MIEQWFLDLDGVRSGPYQTPEVMSLIAEGEVLPHHRISTSLQDQRWKTILDWRLEHAKLSKHFAGSSKEVLSVEGLDVPAEKPVPFQTPPHVPPHAPVNVASQAPPPSVPAPSPTPVATPAPVAQQPAPQTPASKTVAPPPKPEPEEPIQFEEVVSHAAPPDPFENVEEEADEDVPPPPPAKEARPRRDPMAEMFDILQNTKQKREAKQATQTSHGVIHEKDKDPSDRSGNLKRTLAIGLGVTLVGFALGQLFQQQATPPKEPVAVAKPTPAPAPVTAAPSSTTEVIDRSTDKMIIRGTVEKIADAPAARSEQATPTQSPAGRVSSKAAHSTAPSDNPQTEKELEELQNLKKELQELKNLKNNQDDDPAMNPDVDGAEGVDTYAPPPPAPDGSEPNPDQQPLTR